MHMYHTVALRKESVDRNANFEGFFWWVEVALRKESVDRNIVLPLPMLLPISSLSARRAWIEMDWASVISAMTGQSLSARRAWIEIKYAL